MTSACHARYLGLLTVSEIATVHGSRSSGQPFDDALDRHIDDLKSVRKVLDRRIVRNVAEAIASAKPEH